MSFATWVRNQRWLSEEDLVATVEQFQAALDAINVVTNELAIEVANLRDLIKAGGLTAEQEAQVLESLASIEAKLKAIASEPV